MSSPAIVRAAAAILLGAGLTAPGAAAASTAPVPHAPGSHTLYLGADLGIELNGKVRPVEDVQGSAFVVDVDHKRVVLRTNVADLRLKIDSVMKVTTSYAELTHLKVERAYTPGADPRHRARDAMEMAADAASLADQAEADLRLSESSAGVSAANNFDREGHPNPQAIDYSTLGANFDAVRSAGLAQGSNLLSVSDAISREDAELREERFDALRVKFDLASPERLDDAYVVMFVRFRERPDDPKTARLMVNAQHVPAIEVLPHSVTVFRGGFPPGYQLESYQIHLYNHGLEVATTAAPKQMVLSRDDALQFYIIEYSARNRDNTVPASPARIFWSADVPPRLKALPRDLAFFVRVGKDGKPLGVFEDVSCQRKISDPAVARAASDLRFFPALRQGKPVEAVAQVKVADFSP